MKRKPLTLALALCALITLNAHVTVTTEALQPIKLMNAVNNGPIAPRVSQCRDNFQLFRDARFPLVRTHDSSFSESYGLNHVVDVTSIFPDFSKDPYSASSYDFTLTDRYLKTCMSAGSQIFYRLGQKIEHYEKKYGILPPVDFSKWAIICEHIIRHCNEGWANGHHWNIRYWEIWNEPDLDINQWKTNPRTWGGDEKTFHEFYKVAALHLHKCFPHLKIGGPALAGNEEWADRFLAEMSKSNIPMDFWSWHIYTADPMKMAAKASRMRAMMQKYGYGNAESILNEWNYIRNWNTDFPYSVQVIKGLKGAAFNAAAMSACQDAPVDILMYYDARVETPFNGLFDFYSQLPYKGYYPFYAWAKLVNDYGTQVKTAKDEKDTDIYVTAAISKEGKMGILLTRYQDDDNVTTPKKLNVTIPDGYKDVVAHVTDSHYLYTEQPLQMKDHTILLMLPPHVIVFIELQKP